MKNSKPIVIIVLMVILLFLIILNLVLNKKPHSANVEHFQATLPASSPQSASSGDLFQGTHEFVEYSKNSDKLMDMFKSLEDAEKKCEKLESDQLQREEKEMMRDNDKIYKELQEQDKKIHELKEIVKYLTIEKKRRDKINTKCLSNKQRKLNENYNIVKSLNEDGFLRDNSVELDLNISDSDKMKNFISTINETRGQRQSESGEARYTATRGNGPRASALSNQCPLSGDGYVNIDDIGLEKCYGCDKDALTENENYIARDFD